MGRGYKGAVDLVMGVFYFYFINASIFSRRN